LWQGGSSETARGTFPGGDVLRQSCGPVRKQITKSGQVLVRTERVLGHYVFTPSGGMSGVLNLDLLLIDEFGYLNLRPEQSNIFFKLMEERYHRHSTIITTNLIYDEWKTFLGNKSMVEALLSRVRHYCHTVTITGDSLRDPQG
jgi:hypothetical protein